jgi:predicted MFS family arabinose efflux permease
MEGNLAIARSMAADMKHLSKHDTFGKINAATSVAYILGPLLGGFLADGTLSQLFSLSTPFYIMSPLFLALSLLSYYVVSEKTQMASVHRSTWERIYFVKRLQALCSNEKFKLLLIIVSLHTLAADIFYEFGPVFLTMKWMLTPSELAIYNGLLCVGLTIGSGFLSAFLSKKLEDQKVVSISMLGFVLFIFAIVFVEQPKMMLTLFFAIGVALAVATTYLTVQVSDAASENNQGEVMGVQTSLRVLGDALICLSGGIILLLSCKLVLMAAAIISLCTLIYLLRSTASKELSTL